MIEVKDLRKTYVLGGEEVHALDGVSLTIKIRSLWRLKVLPEAENRL